MPPLPPSWDGFHPLFVHFPVALLLAAPVFLVLAGLTGKRTLMVSALLLLLMGVVGSFLATNTGEEAYAVMEPNYDLESEDAPWAEDPYDVAEEHGEQAEFARNVFVGATVLYAIVVVLGFAKESTRKLGTRMLTHGVVLAVAMWGNLIMANAAHLGGELVHRYGVRAVLAEPETEEEAEAEEAADDGAADDGAADSEEEAAAEPSDEETSAPAGEAAGE